MVISSQNNNSSQVQHLFNVSKSSVPLHPHDTYRFFANVQCKKQRVVKIKNVETNVLTIKAPETSKNEKQRMSERMRLSQHRTRK